MKYTDIKAVLSVAGSDSSGGAGIQADIKTILANGCYAMTAITALTAQNTQDVRGISEVSPAFLKQQIETVCEDILPDAVKVGMVSSAELIHEIAAGIRRYGLKNVVVDPVMVSTSGCRLLSEDAVDSLVDELFPLADIITPNIPEAELLAGETISSPEDMERVGCGLARKYEVCVLMKGGHSINDANDLLATCDRAIWINGIHIETRNTHGTGCTLSSAIASYLAKGCSLEESVRFAKKYCSAALFHGINMGHGSGPLNHGWNVLLHEHPVWAKDALRQAMALYAVTDETSYKSLYERTELALRGGATMIQLREKHAQTEDFLETAREIKKLTDAYHVPLIINDNVTVACLTDADGVHIGQEDTDVATARRMLGADKIIGVSAHTVEEARRAEKEGADYIGVGAVFATETKDKTVPVSFELLRDICGAVDIPAVAIGGINSDNIAKLKGSGIAGVAVVSAVFGAEDVLAAAKEIRAAVSDIL